MELWFPQLEFARLGSISLNLTNALMVGCIGTCGAHVRLTAVQTTIWVRKTVLSARRQIFIIAVARRPMQYSSGILSVEYQGCTSLMISMVQDLPILDTPLSTHSELHGGIILCGVVQYTPLYWSWIHCQNNHPLCPSSDCFICNGYYLPTIDRQ